MPALLLIVFLTALASQAYGGATPIYVGKDYEQLETELNDGVDVCAICESEHIDDEDVEEFCKKECSDDE